MTDERMIAFLTFWRGCEAADDWTAYLTEERKKEESYGNAVVLDDSWFDEFAANSIEVGHLTHAERNKLIFGLAEEQAADCPVFDADQDYE